MGSLLWNYFLGILEVIFIVLLLWLFKYEFNKDNMNEYVKIDRENLRGFIFI